MLKIWLDLAERSRCSELDTQKLTNKFVLDRIFQTYMQHYQFVLDRIYQLRLTKNADR